MASQSPLRTTYLTLYNTIFSLLWTTVLLKTLSHMNDDKQSLFDATSFLTRWIQTASFLEVIHSAIGLIPSPLATTALQISVRIIHVWMVWYAFPSSTASSSAYAALLLAWSMADAVRYAYLALNLFGRAPVVLVWLRYSLFYPLYLIGIASEWWLLYLAIPRGRQISSFIPPFLGFLLLLYAPGSFVLYTYMIRQRKKALGRNLQKQRKA